MFDEDYAGLELSTQIIIREALRRGVDVEVLDHSDNFIRLRKAGRTAICIT
jgi:glutamate--cysteine ligase